MSNETMINPINNSNSTVINSELQPNNATVINQELNEGSNLSIGSVLGGKYIIENKLQVVSGEADLYICDYLGKKYVAKVYRRKISVKQEVIDKLKQINSPYVAKLFDTGTVNGMSFEILPYYKNGSVQGKKFTYNELKNNIIPCINEGLNALHSKDIVHKDLKPSNIMLNDDGRSVSIIDFGISSVFESGSTVIITKTGMTPEYSAPETFRGAFLDESDYYSFGVTVCELFCGYSPYANMSQEEIAQYVSIQRIPMPENMPAELSDFINALTYYDITNRNNKANPNRRWTYEEVKNWCDGIKQTIPGEGIGNSRADMKPYNFNGKDFYNVKELVEELLKKWDAGKKELFRGYLSAHFKNNSNQKLARICEDSEGMVSNSTNEDIIYMKTLYMLAPEIKTFYWKGKSFNSLLELGSEMLAKLWKDDKSDFNYYQSILSQKVLSLYVEIKSPSDVKLNQASKHIEDMYKVEGTTNPKKVYYLMAYMLSGQKIFNFEGKQFRTVEELARYMKEKLDVSYEAFQSICHKLIDYKDNLDLQFECWLIALGKGNELKSWKTNLKG